MDLLFHVEVEEHAGADRDAAGAAVAERRRERLPRLGVRLGAAADWRPVHRENPAGQTDWRPAAGTLARHRSCLSRDRPTYPIQNMRPITAGNRLAASELGT